MIRRQSQAGIVDDSMRHAIASGQAIFQPLASLHSRGKFCLLERCVERSSVERGKAATHDFHGKLATVDLDAIDAGYLKFAP